MYKNIYIKLLPANGVAVLWKLEIFHAPLFSVWIKKKQNIVTYLSKLNKQLKMHLIEIITLALFNFCIEAKEWCVNPATRCAIGSSLTFWQEQGTVKK